MTDQHRVDLIEVLTNLDGQWYDEINAYVTAYPISEDKIVVELEYADTDNQDEIIENVTFNITIEE